MDKNIQPGTIIAGKYAIEKLIGSGGMGVVVKARQAGLDRPVAIKVLLSTHRDRADFVERFYREAKAAARVRGDHIAQIFDIGRTDEGDPYMAMEYLEGEDLSKVLKREGRLPLATAVAYMLHACAGVAEAHEARVVHRDLKPANFFLAVSGGKTTLKVIDFGISKVEETASALTATGSALGTAYYMAPEQIESPKTVDTRLDIWALGVIFFELVTGEIPFGGESLAQVVAGILRNNRPKARSYVPDLPPRVDAVIDRCLQSEPAKRYQSAQELANAIARVLEPGAADDGDIVPELDLPPQSQHQPHGNSFAATAAVHAPMSQAPRSAPAGGRTAMMEIESLDLEGAPQIEIDRSGPPPGMQQRAQQQYGGSYGPQQGGSYGPQPSSQSNYRAHQTGDPLQRSLATAEHSPRRKSPVPTIIGAVVAAVVLISGGLVLAAPSIASSALKNRAAESGIMLTQESTSFSLGGVELTNVEASFGVLPLTTMRAAHGHASTSGQDVTFRDVEIESTATLDDLSHAVRTANPALPKNLRLEQVHLTHKLASDITLEIFDATLVTKPNAEGRMLLTSPRAMLRTPAGNVGPFAVTLDQTSATDTRLKLAATDTSGAVLTIGWSPTLTNISIRAPRGIYAAPMKAFGLAPDDTLDLAAKIDATIDANGVVHGGGEVALSHVRLGSSSADVAWELVLSGTSENLVADTRHARIGPFLADVHGQWGKPQDRSAYFTFRTTPISCRDVARARASDGSPTALLADLVQYAGVVRVDGQAAASGVVELAMRSPPSVSTSLSRNDSCGLTIFPGK